jgi:Uma2 family endonuclease
MVTILTPQPQLPQSQPRSRITLDGVSWSTFQQLMAEMGEVPDYGIDYAQKALEIRCLSSNDASSASYVMLHGISWPTYAALMADVGDGRAWRIAYREGILEIRMPLQNHEVPKGMLESFVEAIADELEIEVLKLGAWTLKREDLKQTIEPDSCFYIENEARVRGRQIELPNDPPPDLVIESDYTNSSLDKHAIYAALGVPESWRYHKNQLQVYRLNQDKYELARQSLVFPMLPITEIPALIEQSQALGQRAVVRLLRDRLREVLGLC